MSRPAWFGVLPFLTRGRAGNGDDKAVQGLVIAGGGARASFQIGALRYLYEREHIAPTVVTATSAGSILGALLCQSRDPAEQLRALKGIEELWLSMQTSGDMFAERPWFTRLKSHSAMLEAFRQAEAREEAASSSRLDEDDDNGRRVRLLGRWSWPGRANADQPAVEQPAPESAEPEEIVPQVATLALAMAEEPPTSPEWSPNLLYQLFTGLPHIGRVGSDLTAAVRGLERSRSLFKPGPILERLLSRDFFRSETVTQSGMIFRCAFVGLNSGELHYMRQDGQLVNRNDEPLGGKSFDISMGVLASCSIPGVFKPVEMNGEWYVDGGIRENVPVEEAVAHLGVTRPYVIVSGPEGLDPEPGVGAKDLVSILFRVSSIRGDESDRDEVAYARSTGAVVIEPELLVHNSMSIDPGLLTINRDYGWMRAAEAVREASPEAERIDREIIQARLEAWRLEKQVLDSRREPGNQDILSPIGAVKERLRQLVLRADPQLLPEGAQLWWQGFEAHPASPATS
ncbi:Patatin-like phospholipase [Propionibacterium cyclohexanicum]|uniref:Patatin-like phospholipase n=1 Tax=Propionibacterium cyclohexanicum TaxID=64702 RepID=A0A1H9TK10_9ACTN|nr:patatin-like phospholipase family protein [Propionibacterium cyclohexanicum]SER97334.1 Patatin-like phospholipase [Propionibacterium cyclohexanicum]